MNRQDGRLAAAGVWEGVLRLLGECSDQKILDVPAGNGMLSRIISGMGAKVFSLDIVPAELPGVDWVKSDINLTLPFKNEQFDKIICVEGIEHVENPSLLLREFSRVIKDKGTLILTTPNTVNIRSRIKFALTGFLFWFGDRAIVKYGHITPLFFHQLKYFSCNAHFEITAIASSRKPIWMQLLSPIFMILGALFKEKYNDDDLLSGEILILKLIKTQSQ